MEKITLVQNEWSLWSSLLTRKRILSDSGFSPNMFVLIQNFFMDETLMYIVHALCNWIICLPNWIEFLWYFLSTETFFTLQNTHTSTFHRSSTQPVIICSKLTIETLEQGTKYVPKSTIKTPMPSFCCLYC